MSGTRIEDAIKSGLPKDTITLEEYRRLRSEPEAGRDVRRVRAQATRQRGVDE